jgi:hypothetical protein
MTKPDFFGQKLTVEVAGEMLVTTPTSGATSEKQI